MSKSVLKHSVAISPHWSGQYMWSATISVVGREDLEVTTHGFSEFRFTAKLRASLALFRMQWEIFHGKP